MLNGRYVMRSHIAFPQASLQLTRINLFLWHQQTSRETSTVAGRWSKPRSSKTGQLTYYTTLISVWLSACTYRHAACLHTHVSMGNAPRLAFAVASIHGHIFNRQQCAETWSTQCTHTNTIHTAPPGVISFIASDHHRACVQ